jgi:hypothetical protein
MRSSLAFDPPAGAEESCQNQSCFCRRPKYFLFRHLYPRFASPGFFSSNLPSDNLVKISFFLTSALRTVSFPERPANCVKPSPRSVFAISPGDSGTLDRSSTSLATTHMARASIGLLDSWVFSCSCVYGSMPRLKRIWATSWWRLSRRAWSARSGANSASNFRSSASCSASAILSISSAAIDLLKNITDAGHCSQLGTQSEVLRAVLWQFFALHSCMAAQRLGILIPPDFFCYHCVFMNGANR